MSEYRGHSINLSRTSSFKARPTPKRSYSCFAPLLVLVNNMEISNPPIPFEEIAGISATHRSKLKSAGIVELTQLYLEKGKLRDSVELASITGLSIQTGLEVRHKGRKHIISLLAEIAAKRKIDPFAILWKIHWLLGIVPSSELREEGLTREYEAIASVSETLESAKAAAIDRIIILLLHRTLFYSGVYDKKVFEQLVSTAEKFQRASLLAYRIAKAKDVLMAVIEAEKPAQQVVALRKTRSSWSQISKALEEREELMGQKIITARRAADSLAVLDISEQHLMDRIKQTMTTTKLRQSQLTQITALMNIAVELHDVVLVASLAERASRIWFELAQGKTGTKLTDHLLRSFRFARTATLYSRVLDDSNKLANLVEHLSHLLSEFPTDNTEALLEVAMGVMNTLVRTIPLLNKQSDGKRILLVTQRIRRIVTTLSKQITDKERRLRLVKLYTSFLQVALTQMEQLGVSEEVYQEGRREIVQTLLTLADAAEKEEQETLLDQAVNHTISILDSVDSKTKVNPLDLEIVSAVAARLARRPREKINEEGQQLMERSHKLNEQIYAQTRDSAVRGQMALQLLLAEVAPDAVGVLSPTPPEKFEKLEEYATTALIGNVKTKQRLNSLKAGAVLVGLLLKQVQNVSGEKQRLRLKHDARDFASKTLAFMPPAEDITGEAYPYALLILRCLSDLVPDEQASADSEWEQLLQKGEQLAMTLAAASSERQETDNQLLAFSAAATATASLASIQPIGPERARLFIRATKQIEKALDAASKTDKPESIEAIVMQYNKIMRSRLSTILDIEKHMSLFDEWSNTCSQAAELLEHSSSKNLAGQVKASCILNTEIPLEFLRLSKGTQDLESAKRKITSLLQKVGKIGGKQQRELASKLERRWAFQLGADAILVAGFRIEATKTGFTLADEKFRISLKISEKITVTSQSFPSSDSFLYLRPISTPNSPIWYELNPALCSVFNESEIYRWLTIDEASETSANIRVELITQQAKTITYSIEMLTIEAPIQNKEGITMRFSDGELQILRVPTKTEYHQQRGKIIFELNVVPETPEPLKLRLELP